VEGDQDRHDLAQAQGTISLELSRTTAQQLAVPERQKDFTQIIDMAE
jgi:hypothetical protein